MQPCSTFKPGESLSSRNDKFKNVGHGVVYSKGAAVQTAALESVAVQSQIEAQPTHFRVPDRRGVMAAADQRSEGRPVKKFLGTTTYGTTFPDFKKEIARMASMSLEQYKAAFDRVDVDQSGYIEVGEVQKMLREAYQAEPPAREVNKFISFFDKNQDGKISWQEFEYSLSAVKELLARDTQTGGGRMNKPGWMTAQVIPRSVTRAPVMKSSYGMDMGQYGSDPAQRDFMRKTGMESTTADLNPGTTKDTYQIPGYAGFIPGAKQNPESVTHADGVGTRCRGEDLRLYHNHNVPGYTGHAPVDCANDFGERQGGSSHTTAGAAALGL